jgi:hypothetical protein
MAVIESPAVLVTRPIAYVSKEDTVKSCIMSVLFTAVLGFVGCVSTSESSDPSQRQMSEALADDPSAAGPDESVEAAASCSSAGGVCRKSACRAGEVLSQRLECGTDAACCVPVL